MRLDDRRFALRAEYVFGLISLALFRNKSVLTGLTSCYPTVTKKCGCVHSILISELLMDTGGSKKKGMCYANRIKIHILQHLKFCVDRCTVGHLVPRKRLVLLYRVSLMR